MYSIIQDTAADEGLSYRTEVGIGVVVLSQDIGNSPVTVAAPVQLDNNRLQFRGDSPRSTRFSDPFSPSADVYHFLFPLARIKIVVESLSSRRAVTLQ